MAEISPLRRRMIEDMPVRNLSPATRQSYVHAVSKFSRSPLNSLRLAVAAAWPAKPVGVAQPATRRM
jgi:hypothetical protein